MNISIKAGYKKIQITSCFCVNHSLRKEGKSRDGGNSPVLCLGQEFWGTQVSLYLNFRGTFTNSGGHTKSFKFLPVKIE